MAILQSRQQAINRAIVAAFGTIANKAQYEAYRRLGYAPDLPEWDEAVISLRPELASDETYEQYLKTVAEIAYRHGKNHPLNSV